MLTDYKDSGLKKIKIVLEKHYKLMCCCMIKKRTKNFHFTLHEAEGLCLMKRFQETLHKFAI